MHECWRWFWEKRTKMTQMKCGNEPIKWNYDSLHLNSTEVKMWESWDNSPRLWDAKSELWDTKSQLWTSNVSQKTEQYDWGQKWREVKKYDIGRKRRYLSVLWLKKMPQLLIVFDKIWTFRFCHCPPRGKQVGEFESRLQFIHWPPVIT